jgi:hypothetical protein
MRFSPEYLQELRAEARARAESSTIERAIELLDRFQTVELFATGPDACLRAVMGKAKAIRGYRRKAAGLTHRMK